VREPVDVGVEVAIGESALAVHYRELAGPGGGGAGQAVADVDPADEVAREIHRCSSFWYDLCWAI
jgi:hypothetical protein